ncbi:YdcH family protein [Roseibium sp.]|uniref:YdcH family protein n=1 Tax=Roseibium sp. TaxID=1936156 RepID=UPI003BAEE979
MSHVPHELHEEFPEAAEALHHLKINDAHFARLADEYHTINREVHRIETDVAPASDEVLEDLKKKRLHLKDQIAALLAAAANTAS